MMTFDKYAVFGHPISQSKSPRIHQLFAQQTRQNISYVAQDVPADSFTSCVEIFFEQGGKGLNCTVPLKELAWQLADNLTERAQLSKAVNTLVLKPNGSILGDNTDGIGLIKDLIINHEINLSGSRILILGAGGATRGILPPLLEQHPSLINIANRTLSKADAIVDEFKHLGPISSSEYSDFGRLQFDLIINATSASLSGQLPPLIDKLLAKNGCCYDLSYSNQRTVFVNWGLTQNARKSIDGLGMLVEQAAEAFELWRGIRPDTVAIIDLLNSERLKTHHYT